MAAAAVAAATETLQAVFTQTEWHYVLSGVEWISQTARVDSPIASNEDCGSSATTCARRFRWVRWLTLRQFLPSRFTRTS